MYSNKLPTKWLQAEGLTSMQSLYGYTCMTFHYTKYKPLFFRNHNNRFNMPLICGGSIFLLWIEVTCSNTQMCCSCLDYVWSVDCWWLPGICVHGGSTSLAASYAPFLYEDPGMDLGFSARNSPGIVPFLHHGHIPGCCRVDPAYVPRWKRHPFNRGASSVQPGSLPGLKCWVAAVV